MDVTTEKVVWDTENNGNNVFEGETPLNSATDTGDIELTLCRYDPRE